MTVGSIAVGSSLQYTAKLKNTGTCAAVFNTRSTDSLSIGTGVGTGTGTGVVIEDLELSITPQRVSIHNLRILIPKIFLSEYIF